MPVWLSRSGSRDQAEVLLWLVEHCTFSLIFSTHEILSTLILIEDDELFSRFVFFMAVWPTHTQHGRENYAGRALDGEFNQH